MNSERPDNPETPDEGPEPDATERIGAVGDDVTEAAEAGPDAADKAGPDPADEGDETDEGASDAAREVEPDVGADDGHVVEVGGAGKPRRRRPRVAVAAVAAAVLLVGVGGAYLATSASGGSEGSDGSAASGGDGTPPTLALDGYGGGGSNGIAPGEPNPNGVTYRADGELPDGPDSAPVYSVKGEVTAAEVARLAKALGMEGKPSAEGETWRVGSVADGSGASLQVGKQSPGTWTFNRYAQGTDNCQKVDVCTAGTAAGGAEAADPVSEAVAEKAAAPILKAVGQDDAKVDATRLIGAIRVVNADPEVGGLPTYGWATGVQVGADGQVVAGSGNLKAPVKGDTYPVVDAERALDLMNGSGQGVGTAREDLGGCATPVPMDGGNGPIRADESPCEPATTLPKPEAVTVENAVFGLASHHVDGRPALVPSWMFEVRPTGAEESYTVTHPAVDPKYLASPEPRSEPTERPGDDPTTGPTSRDVEIQGYTADGKELTVSFWGGVCSDYSASATEEKGKVTVTVTDTPWEGKVCIMIAKVVERTVRLDQPLGDRKVVGSDGKEIPKGGIAELEPQ
ncbi:hypothetical protein [Streptomyces ipomoeae]|uniref:hypothetical protein n=1 Tax=Streptomyces ipomoeae TaxID=103232 RepID=UPI001146EA94|nr:hypothetical protein [Streptomyces ipomoeae]MDX2935791.1 hypothetical protein [Streptomyces ipomoeae]TQE22370.1 hypothetical protein SipoB123_23565 [Streptomyces ipomoeae]